MTILMVNPAMRPVCGRTAMALHLMRALHARGHTVALLTGEDSDHALLSGLPFEVLYTRMDPDRKSPGSILVLRRSLKRAIIDIQPDIVHTHHRYPAYIAGRWADLRGVLHVTTVHSHVGGRKRFRIVADRWVAVSKTVQSWLVEQFGVDVSDIEVIYNGAPAQPVREDLKRTFEERGLSVLAAGRFSTEKGFDVLLRAWKEFLTLYRAPARLTIAGEGPEEQRLRALAAGMEASVDIFNGSGRMDELYAQANLVVVPSRQESLSYIVLEAGMRGIPLIVSASGGPAELVTHGLTGRVVPVEDAGALTEALRVTAQEYDEMQASAVRLREELLARHSVNAMTDAYIRLYEHISIQGGDCNTEETMLR